VWSRAQDGGSWADGEVHPRAPCVLLKKRRCRYRAYAQGRCAAVCCTSIPPDAQKKIDHSRGPCARPSGIREERSRQVPHRPRRWRTCLDVNPPTIPPASWPKVRWLRLGRRCSSRTPPCRKPTWKKSSARATRSFWQRRSKFKRRSNRYACHACHACRACRA
jgi:hypothetical protein